jgi:Fe-S-cluster-containing hydrogenase component 2
VGLQLVGVGPELEKAIVSHVFEKWDPEEVAVFQETTGDAELDGILVVGDGRPAPPGGVLVSDSLKLNSGSVQVPEVLFQIDAKLGRLTKSYLAKQATRTFMTRDAGFSRRELLLGVTKGFRRPSPLPYVFGETCEAKRGCRRCVDVCPSNALQISDGVVQVSETNCTVCGICAAVCPVGAVQMPELSDAALFGLLDAIDSSDAPKKTLVITCNGEAVEHQPWMVIEKLTNIGLVGARFLAAAAASSLGGVAVVCPDGKCVGGERVKQAADAFKGSVPADSSEPFVLFAGEADGIGRLAKLHEASKSRNPRAPRSGDKWKDYVADLTSVLSAGAPASGLGLTGMVVSDSCTLCSACEKACPHRSLKMDDQHLFFNASTCTGCGACVTACPEHAITLTGASGEISRVTQSEQVFKDELVACVRCGKPIGSAKFVNKVSSLLGTDAKMVKYCPSCKKAVLVESIFGGNKHG